MRNNPDGSVSWLAAFAAATAIAYTLAHFTHAEWGFSRIVIREDALGMAGLLVVAISTTIVFRRKKGS
jgi:hypothetical protein